MNFLAVVLVVLSALIHASRDFVTKKAQDKQVFVWWYEVFALVFFLPLFAYFMVTEGLKSWVLVLIGVGAGAVHFIYWVYLSKSLQHGDLSHVYPIMRASPLLVYLFSVVFWNQRVSLFGALGIGLIVLGAYSINLKKATVSAFLEPITSFSSDRATQFALITMVAIAAYSLVDKFGVTYINPIIYVYFLTLFALVFYTPYVFRIRKKAAFWREWKENKRAIISNGFFVISSYTLALVAFTMESASYVVALRQIGIVFAIFLGGHILGEKHKEIRLAASVLILAGAILVSIAT